MENEEKQTTTPPVNSYRFYIAVKFPNSSKGYYFGTNDDTLKNGEKVVIENAFGTELAVTCSDLHKIETYKNNLELKPVLRKASEDDILLYEHNMKKAGNAISIAQEEITNLGLDMSLIGATYSLDGSKVTISYVSENRVDFRELLRILAPRLHCRIELRQVGARDRAKSIGGIGICGLPLCCASFLNDFDGIAINRAKNQLLALNIQKLSGHCGKLICCLLYEDDAYTIDKKEFPEFGTKLTISDKEYRVVGMNIISRNVKIASEDDYQVLSLDDFKKLVSPKKEQKDNEKRTKLPK